MVFFLISVAVWTALGMLLVVAPVAVMGRRKNRKRTCPMPPPKSHVRLVKRDPYR